MIINQTQHEIDHIAGTVTITKLFGDPRYGVEKTITTLPLDVWRREEWDLQERIRARLERDRAESAAWWRAFWKRLGLA